MHLAGMLSRAYLQQEYQMSVKCLECTQQQAAVAVTPDMLKWLQEATKLDN